MKGKLKYWWSTISPSESSPLTWIH